MARKRRTFSAAFKSSVALEAVGARDSLRVIAARHQLHPNQVGLWKRRLVKAAQEVFSRKKKRAGGSDPLLRESLAAKTRIGRLTDERDFYRRVFVR